MKPIQKHVSGSANKEFLLNELQKEKEKILREMQERNNKKRREIDQRKEKAFQVAKTYEEKIVKEKTPPPAVKKFQKIPQKSFAEIMEEAALRSKQHSNNFDKPIPKKINITNNSLSSISVKRKIQSDTKDEISSMIPNKKPKLNGSSNLSTERQQNVPLKPINSVKKPVAQNSSKTNDYPSKLNREPTQKSGIMAQNSSYAQNKKIPSKNNEEIVRKSNDMRNFSHQKVSDKIGQKLNATQSSNQQRNPIRSSENTTKMRSDNRFTDSKLSQQPSKIVQQIGAQNSKSKLQSLNGQTRSFPDQGSKSRPMASANNLAPKSQPYQNSQKKSQIAPLLPSGRGICAQNATHVNRVSQNYPPKKTSNGFPPQPQMRGIAAQNHSRGIMAQAGRPNKKVHGGMSESDFSEEYDSDLGSFIDDSEYIVDDKIKKEIYKSLNFNPDKYDKVSQYDDCRNMESRFNDICKEEVRSSRIGREEDLREMRELEKEKERKVKMKSKH